MIIDLIVDNGTKKLKHTIAYKPTAELTHERVVESIKEAGDRLLKEINQ